MSGSKEWWQDFFRGPWGDFQAGGFALEKASAEVDFLVSTLGLREGDKVLDLACGIGRHSVELAARGIEVTGLDFNGAILAVAEQAAKERGVSPSFIEQDMRELTGSELYDAVICFWTSFGYFENEADDLAVAKRVADALTKPGGRFLIDIQVAETVFPHFQERRWNWLDEEKGKRVLEEVSWDTETGRVNCEWTFLENGSSRSASSSIRMYTYRELCELLRQAGFAKFEGFETVTGKPFRLGSQRLSLVATC